MAMYVCWVMWKQSMIRCKCTIDAELTAVTFEQMVQWSNGLHVGYAVATHHLVCVCACVRACVCV